jgi:hypothetical protein
MLHAQAAGRPTNLPSHPTRLIGRERDVAEVRQRLLHAERGLMTLTGAGGSGKTSLALEAARGLLDQFSDGVWLAGLAPLADPVLVPQAVAAACAKAPSGRCWMHWSPTLSRASSC